MAIISKEKLFLSGLRALQFNVLCSVRFIFVQVINKKLDLYIYSERELTEIEKDIYYAVSGEISGDFPELDDSLSEVKFIVCNDKFEAINNQGDLLYARYEETE